MSDKTRTMGRLRWLREIVITGQPEGVFDDLANEDGMVSVEDLANWTVTVDLDALGEEEQPEHETTTDAKRWMKQAVAATEEKGVFHLVRQVAKKNYAVVARVSAEDVAF